MSVVALAGNPNCGKTTLFNRLTGLNQKVGNYPGVTIERRAGRADLGGRAVTIIDLPGTYSLISRSRDEAIAFEVLSGHGETERPAVTVVVVDASNLHRNLYLVLSVQELGMPCIVALNMMDLAERAGVHPDVSALCTALGAPVVPIVARTGAGVGALRQAILRALDGPPEPAPRAWRLKDSDEAGVARVRTAVKQHRKTAEAEDHRADGEAVWLLASLGAASYRGQSDERPTAGLGRLHRAVEAARRELDSLGREFSRRVIEARYRQVDRILSGKLARSAAGGPSVTDRLDAVLLHPIAGGLVFVSVMALMFQSIFTWAEPLMGSIEDAIGYLQASLSATLPAGALADLLVDGVVGGVGNVIVFVPQIAVLFAFVAVLEDSGYLARAAFLSDRVMARVGLHGRAFVPLLSGFACAIPAIMATRAIESRRDRLVTILVTPLVSCSARLPVYALIIAALFAHDRTVLGIFTVGGLLMLAMYGLSILFTVGAAFVLKRTLLKSPTPPLVLELPPYRIPEPGSVLRRVYDRVMVFVRDAGTVILALSIVLWALLYFPRQVALPFDPAAERDRIERSVPMGPGREEALADLDARIESVRVEHSFAGRLGRAIEPVIAPLGYDWKIGVGLLASFAAREVFVSTLGLVYGVGDDADEESVPLREKLRAATYPETDQRVYTPLVGLSLMVFFLLAAQCMSTVAVVRRETAGWRWPIFMVAYMTALAWLAAFLVFQGGRLLGFS